MSTKKIVMKFSPAILAARRRNLPFWQTPYRSGDIPLFTIPRTSFE
jgi:hypothetical protein